MKKIVLAIVVMVCISSRIDAQVNFGVKGGLNFDSPSVKGLAASAPSVKSSSGWHAGAFLQVKVPIVGIGVQPELLYTVKKLDTGVSKGSVSYFEVPINLQYGLDLVAVRPFVMAGPYFGFAVNHDKDFKKDNVAKNDWGIGVGAGLDVWKLQVAVRYALGMKDISEADNPIFGKLKNRTLSVSLGYKF